MCRQNALIECSRDVIQDQYQEKSRSREKRVNGSGGFNDLPLKAIQGKAGQRSKEARAAAAVRAPCKQARKPPSSQHWRDARM